MRSLPAIMQPIDWNDYQAFLAIARAGQIARAARHMKVDATTMGRKLRKLEARLGQILFEQTREGQILTEAGEALLAKVEGMEATAAEITAQQGLNSGPSGTLRVSVSEGFGSWFLAGKLSEFKQKYPRLIVDLVANSYYLSLSKREADLGIFLSRPKTDSLAAECLTRYRLRLYASEAYLGLKHLPKTSEELVQDHSFIGYIPDLLYSPELGYLHEIHPDISAGIRSSSINAQCQLIASAAGIGVLPCFIGKSVPNLVPVMPHLSIERSFWLVTHRDTQNLAKVRVFRDWVISAIYECREYFLD